MLRQRKILVELLMRIFAVEHLHKCFHGGGPLIRWAILNRVRISRTGFWPALLIYFLLVVGFGDGMDSWRENWTYPVIFVVGSFQGAAALATLILHVLVEGPITLQRMHDEEVLDAEEEKLKNEADVMTHSPLHPHDEDSHDLVPDHTTGQLCLSKYDESAAHGTPMAASMADGDSGSSESSDPWFSPRSRMHLFFTGDLWYYAALVTASVLGILSCITATFSSSAVLIPFWFMFQLVDVFRWPSMRALSQALYVGGPDLIFTMAMAMLIVLLFSAFTFLVFNRPLYGNEVKPCETFYACMAAHFIGAFHPDGMIEEAVVGSPDGHTGGGGTLPFPLMTTVEEYPLVQFRSFYIRFFQFLWTVLLAALFGAQIVDAYGAIRERESEIREHLRSGCFLCHTDSTLLDSELGPGAFRRHLRRDHNLAHYIFFLQYLREKSADTHTGIEAHVARRTRFKDASWLPLGTSFSLQSLNSPIALASSE